MKSRAEVIASGRRNAAAVTLVECGCISVPVAGCAEYDWLALHDYAVKDERGRFRPTAKLLAYAAKSWRGVSQSRTVAETMASA